jgi:DNA mismatch endonuclease (patch repair protein)
MHKCRYGRITPATNTKFWQTKREGNVARDKRNLRKLKKDGWKVLVIWECQTRNSEKLINKLRKFLESLNRSRRPRRLDEEENEEN